MERLSNYQLYEPLVDWDKYEEIAKHSPKLYNDLMVQLYLFFKGGDVSRNIILYLKPDHREVILNP